MLEINLEFRKGILFVRLNGVLTKHTTSIFEHEVAQRMIQSGIQNLVLNLEELTDIDMKGISSLFYHYEICKKQKGISYICGLQNEHIRSKLKKNRMFQYIKEVEDELSVLHVVAS